MTRRSSPVPPPRLPAPLLPALGLVAALALWWLATAVLAADDPLAGQITPARTLQGARELWGGALLADAASSVYRLAAGLAVALVLGVALGVATGASAALDAASRPVLLFLRMVSPLSWAPLAIGVFGIGDPPVVALVAATALWPIALATADGVRAVDPGHLLVGRAFGAGRVEVWRAVTWPTVRPRLLGGIRAAIGIAWVVLVPAEMLGVTSGLGYAILNAKDQLAYHHITALIVVIGTLGYAIDVVARWWLRTPRQRRAEREAHRRVPAPTPAPEPAA